MVADELRGMNADELQAHVTDLREQLFKLRFQKTTGQVQSAARLGSVRRDIARALTIAKERELAGAKAPEAATASNEEQS
ncbi:MAG: 50S ribosomal protein L29 [Acidobacteria bacterium]|nr:50S ribosomal protein L29 [Acidobacteriota bacterium]